jgi:uncharacterized membrane protein
MAFLFTQTISKQYTMKSFTWHEKHENSLSFGDRLSDNVANGMGSWRFIIIQTVFVII